MVQGRGVEILKDSPSATLTGRTMDKNKTGNYRGGIRARQFAAYLHEVTHLYNGDLEAGGDVQEIETRTHRQLLEALESIKEDMHKS